MERTLDFADPAVALHANAAGELDGQASAVLECTRKMNIRIDSWLMEMLRKLR